MTGLCSKPACPLASGNYATVREQKGKLYLFVKKVERQFTPNRLWEKIKLSDNYNEALRQIDQELLYWNKFIVHKSKQRLTKLTEMLRRKRKLRLKGLTRLVAIKKKTERRDDIRMAKAELKAKVDRQIQEELLDRLKQGTYGQIYEDLLNLNPGAFDRIVEQRALDEEDEYAEDLQELELNVGLVCAE